MENQTKTTIEVEFDSTGLSYDELSKLIEKICEDHEGKRDLHIKIKFR